MSFDSLGLSADLLRAIARQGYDKPTVVQARAIPAILAGNDLMAGAQTGTGKTAAFTLPMLQNLMNGTTGKRRRIRALVLTPTRELAAQVGDSVRTYGKYLPLRSTQVFGGVGIVPQMKALRNGVDVLVATPGRLLDHVERGTVDLSQVQILVLDEADRMLDMGFMPAIERVLREIPKQRQTLLFSATFSETIKKLANRLLRSPKLIEAATPNATAEAVTQLAYYVDSNRKRELLSHLIDTQDWRQVLVFTRTKHGADRLAKQLERDGIEATSIHGDKSQGQRTRALASFKRRAVRALVATDVAARGLDITQLPHVVNYDLPNNAEDYVHRIGRTGRGGESGAAISLVCADEGEQLASIHRLLKREIPNQVVQGFEPQRKVAAVRPGAKTPSRRRRSGGRPTAGAPSRSGKPRNRQGGRASAGR
ncbi:MAG: DEAD/DEAH box helicase [Acidiferrobacteraceae bacterium]|jgi:ATP-dependent RNA helicase RhlE